LNVHYCFVIGLGLELGLDLVSGLKVVMHVCIYRPQTLGPRGMEGWVHQVSWPIADTVPTKWSHVNHRSGKVCQSKTDVLTTEPHR